MPVHSSVSNGHSPRFATTRWSLVLLAKDRPSSDSRAALADLCRAYWYPIYSLIRRRSRDAHEAQDLTQGFFTTLLEKNFLGQVDPARGRFRAFLLAAIKHFVANEWDKKRAQKRGGDRSIVSLNIRSFDWNSGESRFAMEPAHGVTPERQFERQWALALLERVLQRLRDEYLEMEKLILFECLQPFLSLDRDAANYCDAAKQLGMTEATARVAAHRLRKRYRELLRSEIAQNVATPDEIEDELKYLFTTLSSPS